MSDQTNVLAPELRGLAPNLQRFRNEQGWTFADLAQRTELSESYLSRLESGDRQPSIAALLKLARAFNVSVAALLEPNREAAGVVVRADAATLHQGNGLLYHLLTRKGGLFNLQAVKITVPAERQCDEQYQHDGEEWLYVLSGQLRLQLEGGAHDLQPGDAAHFDARKPHRLVALGGRDAEVIVVAASLPSPLLGSYF